MKLDDPRVVEFLHTVRADNGEEVARACQDLIGALPPDVEFRPFAILSEARYLLQRDALDALAAMNAQPFD